MSSENTNADPVDSAEFDQSGQNVVPVLNDQLAGFGRLHPTSLVFDILSHFRSLIFPAAITAFSAASGSVTGLILAAAIFLPTILMSIVRYFTLSFRIDDGELVVTQGVFFRRVRTVPVSRIQNIDLVQSILHRVFDVAEVRVETASGTEPEATLRVLSVDHVDLLRSSVFGTHPNSPAGWTRQSTDRDLSLDSEQTISKDLLWIPAWWLVKAGLASNKGMLLICVLLGAAFEFDVGERAVIEQIRHLTPEDLTPAWKVILILGGSLGVLLLLRILGIVWYFLRFHGYQLTRLGEDLRISCGLLTKVSATVPRRRIQFISIHRNLIMRCLGLASVRIETAGGAGKNNQDAAKTVSSRWFVPVIPVDRVTELLNEIRPGLDRSIEDLVWHSVSTRAWSRLSRLAVVQSLIIAAIGLAMTRPWGWAAGLIALPFFIWLAIKKSRAM